MAEQTINSETRAKARRAQTRDVVFTRLPAAYSASRAQGQKLLQAAGGLTIVEWRTLWDLYEAGPLTIRDLSYVQTSDHSLLSRALPDMKRKGFVTMARSPDDGRQTIVSLTEKGRAAYHKAAPIMARRRAALRAEFTPEELATFINMMDRLDEFLRSPLNRFLDDPDQND